jgi:hypothetical protein
MHGKSSSQTSECSHECRILELEDAAAQPCAARRHLAARLRALIERAQSPRCDSACPRTYARAPSCCSRPGRGLEAANRYARLKGEQAIAMSRAPPRWRRDARKTHIKHAAARRAACLRNGVAGTTRSKPQLQGSSASSRAQQRRRDEWGTLPPLRSCSSAWYPQDFFEEAELLWHQRLPLSRLSNASSPTSSKPAGRARSGAEGSARSGKRLLERSRHAAPSLRGLRHVNRRNIIVQSLTHTRVLKGEAVK